MESGGGVLSSSALFVSTTPKSSAAAATAAKAGVKRGRSANKTRLPDGERFTIPADVTAYATAPSTSETNNNLHQHIDMSLATSPSDFSRISLMKEALSTILDPTTRKKLTVNAVTGMQATIPSAKNNKKQDEAEDSSTPLSSLDFSSAVESEVDEDISE